MSLEEVDLELVEKVLIEVALEAGDIIKNRNGLNTFDDKKNGVDLVTEVDKAVEVFINEKLISKFPNYKFMGEESYIPGETKLTESPTFIVDPIDGTTNFIHTFPYSCTSLGFTVNYEPVVGVIYNPHLNLLFHGIKGKGAYLNDKKLENLSDRSLEFQKSLIALESGSERSGENFETKIISYRNFLSEEKGFIHGFRSFGSAAMNICHVALGAVDGYWENCWAWDVCAAAVILRETGGLMLDGNKSEIGGEVREWNKEVPVDNRVYLVVRGAPKEDQKKWVETFYSLVEGKIVCTK